MSVFYEGRYFHGLIWITTAAFMPVVKGDAFAKCFFSIFTNGRDDWI